MLKTISRKCKSGNYLENSIENNKLRNFWFNLINIVIIKNIINRLLIRI